MIKMNDSNVVVVFLRRKENCPFRMDERRERKEKFAKDHIKIFPSVSQSRVVAERTI